MNWREIEAVLVRYFRGEYDIRSIEGDPHAELFVFENGLVITESLTDLAKFLEKELT